MPSLFDLLSENSDKSALKKIGEKAKKSSPKKSDKKNYKSKQQHQEKKTSPKKGYTIYPPDFVALDLETTGLDNKNDRITEIGAVRFIRGEAVEEYATLVNPGYPIPEFITRLTGISDETVKDAPDFINVADEVVKFIGDLPICGHQVDFDFNFLNQELKRAGRKNLESKQFDTASLSRLLLNKISGYSLGAVAEFLGIKLESAHRALDDARASGEVAVKLVPMLNDISPRVRALMGKFAPYSLLKGILIGSTKGVPAEEQEVSCGHEEDLKEYRQRLGYPEEPKYLNPETVENNFKEGGKLSTLIPEFAVRESQAEMAGEMARSLNDGVFLTAEAGTGTGKSMAYLLPSAAWALENNSRVIVSTYTRNLQDQLIDRDLETVKNIVGDNLRFSVLKGRSNYLCVSRWRRFVKGEFGNLSPRERLGTLPLIKWAEETMSGDVEEQNSFNRRWHARVWGMINAEHHGCRGRACRDFSKCFLQNARQKAMGSHVVVINHALFFSEICSGASFLGIEGPVIFDEAHHIQESGHRHLRVEIDSNRFRTFIELLDGFKKHLEKYLLKNEKADDFKAYTKLLTRFRKYTGSFTDELVEWAKNAQENIDENDKMFLVGYRDEPFQGFSSLAGLNIVIKDLLDYLNDFVRGLEEDEQFLDSEGALCLKKCSQLRADLEYLVMGSTEDHVFWLEGGIKRKWAKLCGVPLDVGGLLADIWKESRGAVLFTSATMTVSGKFEYFCRNVGLDLLDEGKVVSQIYESPFESNQMMRCSLGGDHDPSDPGYPEYIADSLAEMMRSLKKNMLVLFTSDSMLKTVHSLLEKSDKLPDETILLAQDISGNRTSLLEAFRENRHAILLGSGSFWEGVDIPGEACEIVVIPRLPFTVPTHPLTKALAERVDEKYGNSFYNYSVPEAVIRFRQGAGRLIRRSTDRGALVVFDRRITTKNYGGKFIRSLGGPFTKAVDTDELIMRLSNFFE